MAGFVLLYEQLSTDRGSWQPLLQHQAIVAVARAILTHGSSIEPELSGDTLFAPLNLEILPLLALVASDFADFAEPEGRERPRPPIRLYDDGSWKDDPEGADELRHLLHQSWFERLNLDFAGTIDKYRPENCVILGDPGQVAARYGRLHESFNRIIHFNHLASGSPDPRARLPGQPIAADGLFEDTIERAKIDGEAAPPVSAWDAALREATKPELEPFVAFGPALEMAALTDDDDRFDDGRFGAR